MASNFATWSAQCADMSRLDELRGSYIGIEAGRFLSQIDESAVPNIKRPINEALLAALGGVPFGLREAFRLSLNVFREHNITPIFVFDGMDIDNRDDKNLVFEASLKSSTELNRAWSLYQQGNNQHTVEIFKQSGAVTSKHLYRFFQTILREENVNFYVAPYDALPQLAYFYKAKVIDAIFASPEVLLYDAPDVVTHWNLTTTEFTFIKSQSCLADLGASPEIFVDAVLLSGTSHIPIFPPVEASTDPSKVKAAFTMIVTNVNRSGHGVCLQYEDNPQIKRLNYLDRYRRARLAIKHHIYIKENGKVEPLALSEAPSDVHEFISNRLHDEVYFYLSKGIISPRLLNWFTALEIIEPRPIDNGESAEYKTLIKDKLEPERANTLAILATTMHRFFRHKRVKLRTWYDDPTDQEIAIAQVPDPGPILSTWNVHEDVYGMEKNKYLGKSGTLGIALKVLSDPEVAKNSVTERDTSWLLESKEEVILNSIWRMLTIRGYISSSSHKLTDWGNVLLATLDALPEFPPEQIGTLVELEEAAILAIEMARLGLLTARDMFPSYGGAPYSKDPIINRNTLLVARVASFAKFSHQDIGYTGPLSRHFLGYASMINAVRESVRDLTEACLVNLLFKGDAVRDRSDYSELGYDLPFLLPNSCALGLAVNAYFMSITEKSDPTSPETRSLLKTSGPADLFQYAVDYKGDLEKAFGLWDAVVAGVHEMKDDMIGGAEERAIWEEVDKWVQELR